MISKNEVKHIANLSRIHLNDAELEPLAKELDGILHYVDQLKKLNVESTQPTSHVLELKDVFREDKIKPSLTQEEALKIAVDKHNGFFKVPQVIE